MSEYTNGQLLLGWVSSIAGLIIGIILVTTGCGFWFVLGWIFLIPAGIRLSIAVIAQIGMWVVAIYDRIKYGI